MTAGKKQWAVAVAAAATLGLVLNLYQTGGAAPRGQPPFSNPAEQRLDQVHQLKEISDLLKEQNRLLKEQNALLSSGKLQVVVTLPEK